MLVGRERERALVDGVLERARAGRSGTVLVRGEAGIGKSALLAYAEQRAVDMCVLRALGVESEVELEFSALLEICRPLLELLDEIPERQAVALRGALGLGPAEGADRFAIGAATLSLLAAAGERQPVLVLVDDAQWLDRSSSDALLFAARRLEADHVALIFAAREGEGAAVDARGLIELTLTGLTREAAAELLSVTAVEGVAPHVIQAMHTATRGNPLALLELPPLLDPRQLAGHEPLVDPLPAGTTLERTYGDRAAALPAPARQALTVAAVSSSAALEPILAALDDLAVDPSWLEPAEDAQLIRIERDRVAFRHPLIRSAVFHAAPPSERRAAHRALGDALADGNHVEERAWHLAAAAVGRDEDAAAALASAASTARERSGYAAAAAALERSARLTPDEDVRRSRLHDAADAAWMAGRKDTALALVEEALDGAHDPVQRARLLYLRGHVQHLADDVTTARSTLLAAAALAEEHDPASAVAMYADAVDAALYGGSPSDALVAGESARSLAPSDGGDADFRAETALGQALYLDGRANEGAPRLQRALELLADGSALAASERHLLRGAVAAGWLDRPRDGLRLAARATEIARGHRAHSVLHHALSVTGWLNMRGGRWAEAYSFASEALGLARESGETTLIVHCLNHLASIDACQGNASACRLHADEAIALARERGIVSAWAERALAFLDLSTGRLDEAARALEALEQRVAEQGYFDRAANLVEAYCRLGRRGDAEAAFSRWLGHGVRASTADARASTARCRGLLAGEDGFEEQFREALEGHDTADDPFGAARTRLCLGERLRRAGRRIDARIELRAALETFAALGAEPWAERARVELRASGETLRREPEQGERLTPQELQVALQVAEGKTNKEVGAALFLSHKTVDFHLRRVYRKLDIRSRGELIRQFAHGAS